MWGCGEYGSSRRGCAPPQNGNLFEHPLSFLRNDKSPWAFRRTLDSSIIAPYLTEFKHFLQISGGTAFYRSAKSPADRTVSVHKEVFSYERLVATSVMEAAAFSLSMVDHGLDDSAIASISFMVARSTSPTPVKWMSIHNRLCPFTISLL